MKKLIAVWGSSGSGKTSFAANLAQSLYRFYKEEKRVAVVFASQVVPVLSYMFPEMKKSEMRSLGAALSKPVITKTDILKNMISVSGMTNFGVMGFIDGENVYSYPEFETDKIKQFLNELRQIVDYVIVDCDPDIKSAFSDALFEMSDILFSVVNPDLKSISWNSSVMSYFDRLNVFKVNFITVVNHKTPGPALPSENFKRTRGDVVLEVPYDEFANKKYSEGKVFTKIRCKEYARSLGEAVEMINFNEGPVYSGVFRRKNEIEYDFNYDMSQDSEAL